MKNLLHKCFAQNIDTLQCTAGGPWESPAEARGSPSKAIPDIGFFGKNLGSSFLIGLRIVSEADLVVMQSLQSIYPFAVLLGRAKVTELGWAEELEKVYGSVGGGSDGKAEAEAGSIKDAEPAYSMDRLGGSVMQDLSIEEAPMTRIVEADLSGENGKVSYVDKKRLGSSSGDQPASSSKSRTNLNTST
ncbi:hypothetical protein HOY80DRAFT_1052199 [Tuber brumale]|nr:hypothetical protein HOY80DRAFT_1052199 [Tuber brumale]